jgi:molecular chaperone DnaK (HSP70)
MAADNFDNNIKNKLENRTIKPTEEAWNKLSEQLDIIDRNKSNTKIWWLGIAASIVGVLFFFLRNTENSLENNTPIVVETQQEVKTKNTDDASPSIDKNNVVKELEKSQPVVSTKSEKTPEIKETKSQPIQSSIVPEDKDTNIDQVVADVAQEPKLESEESIQIEPNNMSFEDQKIQEVVAQIKDLQNQDKDITEEEIDQLLLLAENQIKQKRLSDQSTNTIDANSLLQDVEQELDRSFRDKVLETLKSSYESVKLAVIERND